MLENLSVDVDDILCEKFGRFDANQSTNQINRPCMSVYDKDELASRSEQAKFSANDTKPNDEISFGAEQMPEDMQFWREKMIELLDGHKSPTSMPHFSPAKTLNS